MRRIRSRGGGGLGRQWGDLARGRDCTFASFAVRRVALQGIIMCICPFAYALVQAPSPERVPGTVPSEGTV